MVGVEGVRNMFLYIKDYFHKKIFHILLIVFFSLLTFHSVMTLIDLKNYTVGIYDQGKGHYAYIEMEEIEGGRKFVIEKPYTKIFYEPSGLHWGSRRLLDEHMSVENFTVEYKIYDGETTLTDAFEVEYDKRASAPLQKSYAMEKWYWRYYYEVTDYDIKFSPRVYVPHIFVIVSSLFFIFPSAVMLFKIKKEERGEV